MFSVRAFIALAVLAAACSSANGVSGLAHSGYSIRTWQTEDGLPQNTVTAITQTRDGYIWLGTFGGLARFDGERFQSFDAVDTPGLSDSRIASLFEDAQGVLWIGHDSGKLSRYHRGKFEPFATKTGSREKILGIGADGTGLIWWLRQSGALESSAGDHVTLGRSPSTPTNVGFGRNSRGEIWIVPDGAAARLTEGRLNSIVFGPARMTGYVMGVGSAAAGGFWLVRDGRVARWADGKFREDRGPTPSRNSTVTALVELGDGTIAIGTIDDGLYLMFTDGRTRHFDHGNGLAQNWVRYLYEDREGNLWVAAGTGGLAAVRETAFTVLNPPDLWQGRAVLSVAQGSDGALWVGSEGAGVYRYVDGTWQNFGVQDGLRNQFVWSLATGPRGELWAGTWGGGLYKLEDEKFAATVPLDGPDTRVLALQYSADDSVLWVGTGTGVVRWQRDTVTWPFRITESLASNVCALTRDAKGDMWFGLSEGGLIKISDGKVTRFNKSDGLPSNSVQCLLADGDTLWIGTPDGGLSRMKDGRFATISLKEGLPNNVICHIADDGRGYLWLSTHRGIARIAKTELNRCADGEIAVMAGQVYDRNDGLPTVEYSGGLQAAGCKTADGRLWFTSSKGLVSVDPANIRINPTPPPVVIESLRVDGEAVLMDEQPSRPQLRPEHQRLEFQYTALSLVAANKVLFKYRLEGLDKGWVIAGSKRTASYSHLPAGDYEFQVIACNNDNVWNNTGATFKFSVSPFYWQTWWFRGIVTVSAFGLVAWSVRSVTRRRMQLRLEQVERERAIEAERARIAQDIHDDIGASLTQITMLSQSVREGHPPGAQSTAAVLNTIYGTTREITRSLDEIVWAINPRHDTLDSFVSYMGKFAQEVLSAAEIRCRLDLPVELPPWPLTTQTRHNLLLAFKEALNNAIKHARATEVRVALTLQPRGFTIDVEDNGHGFGAPPRREQSERIVSGNGLHNMSRRLAEIGGRCEVESRGPTGTRITFIVDLRDHLTAAMSVEPTTRGAEAPDPARRQR